MKNVEYYKKYREEQESRKAKFYLLMKNEGFVETIDLTNNFAKNEPLFYKKISDNKFIVFNIPYYGKLKNAFFQADFWKVYVSNEGEFLNKKLKNSDYKDVMLGFTIERDIELYYFENNVG